MAKKPKLSEEGKKFINYGKEAYKNGPWDYEDAHAMARHSAMADALLKGNKAEPLSCSTCGKTVVPVGQEDWMHITEPRSHVNTDQTGVVTSGTSHDDIVDNENHPATITKRPLLNPQQFNN